MRKRLALVLVSLALVFLPAVPALACAGVFDPNGAVKLGRTQTLAAHHEGIEHYITAYKYSGGGGEFGSVVPLPGMPSKVAKGGEWTLQRLQQETARGRTFALGAAEASSGGSAQEVYKTRIDALDITVLKGGGASVGQWAAEHGFRLSPDAPEVLDFYGARSPYFMAAVFDAKAAEDQGQRVGDATTIHVTIPLKDPWVPFRILGLGKVGSDPVQADVYLLTDRVPNLLPSSGNGYTVSLQEPASEQLLADLRSDRGMEWLPSSGMTLTHLIVESTNPQLRYDLATNVHGGAPSAVLAGLEAPPPPATPTPAPTPKPTPVVTPAPTPAETLLAQDEPAKAKRSEWPYVVATMLVGAGSLAAWALTRRRESA
jgi:hypothetical protein